jgi:hypothetical protein
MYGINFAFKVFCLKMAPVKARIWHWLSSMWHIRRQLAALAGDQDMLNLLF